MMNNRPLMIAIYGKAGIGKSTITAHVAVACAKMGKRVLQIGCDPKHDSTYPITHASIPTVIEVLTKQQFHYERITAQDIVFRGFEGVCAVEAGKPLKGSGCGGNAIVETIKILDKLCIYDEFDIVLFDVMGDVVCGGFSLPLQYAEYVCIVVTDDSDCLCAANRIASGIKEMALSYDVSLAGVIVNRCTRPQMVQKFCESINTEIISIISESSMIKKSKSHGITLFESTQSEKLIEEYIESYNLIAHHLIQRPSKKQCTPISEKAMFEAYMSAFNNSKEDSHYQFIDSMRVD